MTSPVPVTIVIPTWNGLEYTKRCLESLRSRTDHPAYEVVVVDNGSTDGTVEFLRSQDWIEPILNSANLGFARANNAALRQLKPGHDAVLLNNDTEISQPDWLSRLQESAYASEDIGIAGCRLVGGDGLLRHAGAYMPVDTLWGQQIGGNERDVNQYSDDRDVESVIFACAYIKRKVIDEVGLLDEDYFCYFEDTDYCRRARAQGFRVVCSGGCTVIHHENVSTQANGIEHKPLFLRGQKVFRSKWEKELRASRYRDSLGWHSILNFPTGYALSSRALVSALDQQGVRVSYRYVYGSGTVFPKEEPDCSGSYLVDLIRRRELDRRIPQVVYAQGDVFQSNFGGYKIGFTMLETDRIPREWVRQANLMDEVWVPSSFNAETFRLSGVERPIHVIPLGFDPDHFNPKINRFPLTGVYTFLSVFEWGERKAPEVLLRAFNAEFRREEPVILLVKAINVDPAVNIARDIADLGLDPAGGCIHVSVNQEVPTYQLGVLYRSADCFVLPTRGEGWGMPIIEAMACGLPAIATSWSAHCDFMTPGNSYPLPIEGLVPARAKCPYYAGSRWAEPSSTHLRRLMRQVFENPSEARAKGECAAREMRAEWTWDHAAEKIVRRMEAIEKVNRGRSLLA
jgi:GT2 family glycosyltransferase